MSEIVAPCSAPRRLVVVCRSCRRGSAASHSALLGGSGRIVLSQAKLVAVRVLAGGRGDLEMHYLAGHVAPLEVRDTAARARSRPRSAAAGFAHETGPARGTHRRRHL